VSYLTRELTALRENASMSPEAKLAFRSQPEPTYLSFETMFEALRRENEQLRSRLVSAERNYIRATHLNDIYREELIDRRRRVCFFYSSIRAQTDASIAGFICR